MATYGDLQPGYYYIVQEAENALLELIYVPMVTDKCVLIEYQDDEQTLAWYRKADQLLEVVEQLTDEQAVIYESMFETDYDDDDDDFFWGDDDDDDDDDFWEDSEEEEDDAAKN